MHRPRRLSTPLVALVAVALLVGLGGIALFGVWSAQALAAKAPAPATAGSDGSGGHALSPGDPPPEEPSGTGDTRHLTPQLRRALARAGAAARADGITLHVTSGWRSAAKQQRLYDAAIAKYGSAEKASHWVLPPEESEHVQGRAVDIGPRAAATWLETNGVRFGLCRRYANEPWHFELLAPHRGQSCPALEPYA